MNMFSSVAGQFLAPAKKAGLFLGVEAESCDEADHGRMNGMDGGAIFVGMRGNLVSKQDLQCQWPSIGQESWTYCE
jgi:hypothetical protein